MTASVGVKGAVKKLRDFLHRNIFIILSFLAPMAIMALVFAVKNYFPFGERMIPTFDAWHQYYPFLTEYQRMLKEGASVLYSWNTGGGANFLGIIANYVASPLYLLSVFVPSGTPWLAAFLAGTVALRTGIAGMSFAVLLRKVFRRNDLSLVTFSLMYALCAYVLGYYWNMMWLDTVAIVPLVIAGVLAVLRENKFSLYIISLALSVICSFYIGYMVCLLVLIFCVCYTIVSFVSFKHSLKNAGRMLVYTLIAFMLTAAVTIPAFMMLQASDSAGSVAGFSFDYKINYAYGYGDENTLIHTLSAIVRTATNMLAYTRPIVVDKGLPNIACGVLSLVLIPFYIFTKKIKLREKIVSMSLLVFFLLSFVVNQLNYIWHGMSTPAMVYYRWSFIFSFAVVFLAYRAFTLIDAFSKKTFIFASILMMLYLGCAFFLQRKLSVAITLAGAVVIIAGFALYRAGRMKYSVLSVLLCLFVICEMTLSAYYGVTTVRSTSINNYPESYEQVQTLTEIAKENSGEDMIYRTEFMTPYTLNDGDLYSLYTITTFNSMVDDSYADFLSEFGLAASKVNNRYAYLETTPVANLFLNIKYLISREDDVVLGTNYLDLVATTDECTLYENTAYVPMGFMADKSLLDYKLHSQSYLSIWGQNDIFRLATGIEEPVLTEVEPVKDIELTEDITLREGFDHKYICNFKEKEEETVLTLDYEVPEDGLYYGCFYSSSVDDTELVVNGDEDNVLTFDQNYSYLASLGEYKKGDMLTARIYCKEGKSSNVTAYLARLEQEVFDKGVEKLSKTTMEATEWSDRGLKGTVNVQEEGLLYTSVLYTEGWSAFVDGEEVEITPVADSFIAFVLPEGEHTVELRYTPVGLYAGIGVSALGVVLFALLCVLRRQSPTCKQTTEENTAECVENCCDASEESDAQSCINANCTDN
ncbi:MAG: YfhO family protein [Ruminococcus sp.]|nr:YfhO family protein [Ruminococcus sp.]